MMLSLSQGPTRLLNDKLENMSDEISRFVEEAIRAGTIPGAALIASQSGKTVYEQTWGSCCTRTERTVPVAKNTRHLFFSYSKMVTTTVFAQVWEREGFALDRPVREFLPSFMGGGKDAITVRHALTHSAGIPNADLTEVETAAGWDAFLAQLSKKDVEWKPGSKTAYHALTGHFLAAAIASKLAGKPWERLCQELLFTPLGAKTLTFGTPAAREFLAITPQPKDLPVKSLEGFAGHPAGGCSGTMQDALKVLQLHTENGIWQGKRLLKPETLAELHRVQYPGQSATHEPWGLGFLLRGPGPAGGGHGWFGFQNQSEPRIFGHAGIDTVIGVADPVRKRALFFATTDSPKPQERVAPLRNGITDRVFKLESV